MYFPGLDLDPNNALHCKIGAVIAAAIHHGKESMVAAITIESLKQRGWILDAERFDALEQDVATMKTDVAQLKTAVGNLPTREQLTAMLDERLPPSTRSRRP